MPRYADFIGQQLEDASAAFGGGISVSVLRVFFFSLSLYGLTFRVISRNLLTVVVVDVGANGGAWGGCAKQ
uniref:Uncharacterized protein n=1 Tax=Moniliophthora roreri TaxID=221103 RepID=A0A0W0FDY5_MONRR